MFPTETFERPGAALPLPSVTDVCGTGLSRGRDVVKTANGRVRFAYHCWACLLHLGCNGNANGCEGEDDPLFHPRRTQWNPTNCNS